MSGDLALFRALALNDIAEEPDTKALLRGARLASVECTSTESDDDGSGGSSESSSSESSAGAAASKSDESDKDAISQSFTSLTNDAIRIAEIKLTSIGRQPIAERRDIVARLIAPPNIDNPALPAVDRNLHLEQVFKMRASMLRFTGKVWATMQKLQTYKLKLVRVPSAATMIRELDAKVCVALQLFAGYLEGTDQLALQASLMDYENYMRHLASSLTKIEKALDALVRHAPSGGEDGIVVAPRLTAADKSGRTGSYSAQIKPFPTAEEGIASRKHVKTKRDATSVMRIRIVTRVSTALPGVEGVALDDTAPLWLMLANNALLGLVGIRLALLVCALESAVAGLSIIIGNPSGSTGTAAIANRGESRNAYDSNSSRGAFGASKKQTYGKGADDAAAGRLPTNVARAALCFWVPSTCAQALSKSGAVDALGRIKEAAYYAARRVAGTGSEMPFYALLNVSILRAAPMLGIEIKDPNAREPMARGEDAAGEPDSCVKRCSESVGLVARYPNVPRSTSVSRDTTSTEALSPRSDNSDYSE
jgi:hypothetical protein